MIIDLAFPNLTANQRQILEEVSAKQDSILGGGQANAASYTHAMRAPDQTVSEAQSEFQDFVSNEEDQATQIQISFWVAGNPGLSNDALAHFAAALHAIEDSTSPAHSGFHVWDWRNPMLVWNHHRAENSISSQQLNTAVSAARTAFNATFFDPFNSSFFNNTTATVAVPSVTSTITFGPIVNIESNVCFRDEGKQNCQ